MMNDNLDEILEVLEKGNRLQKKARDIILALMASVDGKDAEIAALKKRVEELLKTA